MQGTKGKETGTKGQPQTDAQKQTFIPPEKLSKRG
jgi:hypothetical protein